MTIMEEIAATSERLTNDGINDITKVDSSVLSIVIVENNKDLSFIGSLSGSIHCCIYCEF